MSRGLRSHPIEYRSFVAALALMSAAALPAYGQAHILPGSQPSSWLPATLLAVAIFQTAVIFVLVGRNRRHHLAVVELRAQRAEMTRRARLAMLGEISASIAHEVSQPIGAILSNTDSAEILLNQVPIRVAEVQQIIKDIRRDDLRANDIVQRIRSLLQKRELQLQPVDVNEVASDVRHLVQADARRRGIALEFRFDPAVRRVQADPVHLQQVMLNLIINAIEAVDAEATNRLRRIEVQTIADDERAVEVVVRDSGPGFAAEQLAKSFGPFVSTKAHGMGLGLSISRAIIKAHGGRIWNENGAAGGGIVGFAIPVQCMSRAMRSASMAHV